MIRESVAHGEREVSTGAPRRLAVDLWLAAALLVALSPALVDLVSQWISYPWSRYSAVFVPLLAWCAVQEPAARPRPWLGAGLIAVALAVQLLAAIASQVAIARPALAAAVVGFLLLRGLAPMRVALLAVFLVPVPYSLAALLGGVPLSRALFGAGAALVSALGPRVELDDLELASDAAALTLQPIHAGLPLLVLFVGLWVYASLRLSARSLSARSLSARALSPRRALGLAAGCVLAAVAVEVAAVLLACASIALGSAGASRFVLESLAWLIPAVVVVGLTERAVECRARGAGDAAPG